MADRDQQLGPYGLYDAAKTKEVGLKRALLDTAKHLEMGLAQMLDKRKREDAQAEVARLRVKAAGM